jgi:hypothetical protein
VSSKERRQPPHKGFTRERAPTDAQEKIAETVEALTGLLDLERPFTWEVTDQKGMSEIKPADGVELVRL